MDMDPVVDVPGLDQLGFILVNQDVPDEAPAENLSPVWEHVGISLEFTNGTFTRYDDGTYAIKRDDELTVQVADQPITRKFTVMAKRADAYQEVPIRADQKYRENEEDWIKPYPFRIVAANGGNVNYGSVNVDGIEHLVAFVEVKDSQTFKIVFTRNGTDFTGQERAAMKRPMKGRIWHLQLCEGDNAQRVIVQQRIQVFAEVRPQSSKKRRLSGQSPPTVTTENPPTEQEINFGTSIIAISLFRKGLNIPLGHFAMEPGLRPAEIVSSIEDNKAVIKSVALAKVRAHFGLDDLELPQEDFVFTLKTIGPLAQLVYCGGSWQGGPLGLLSEPGIGWADPVLDNDGRPFHIVDLIIPA